MSKLKGNGWGASLETGYPWQFVNGVRIEPQAQLMYLQLNMDDVVDRDNTRVRGAITGKPLAAWVRVSIVPGRIRLGSTPYLRTSYTRGWGGAATSRASATHGVMPFS